MEIATPRTGALAVGYTFEPDDEPASLPPVWRCRCGFQMDARGAGQPPTAGNGAFQASRVPAMSGTFQA